MRSTVGASCIFYVFNNTVVLSFIIKNLSFLTLYWAAGLV